MKSYISRKTQSTRYCAFNFVASRCSRYNNYSGTNKCKGIFTDIIDIQSVITATFAWKNAWWYGQLIILGSLLSSHFGMTQIIKSQLIFRVCICEKKRGLRMSFRLTEENNALHIHIRRYFNVVYNSVLGRVIEVEGKPDKMYVVDKFVSNKNWHYLAMFKFTLQCLRVTCIIFNARNRSSIDKLSFLTWICFHLCDKRMIDGCIYIDIRIIFWYITYYSFEDCMYTVLYVYKLYISRRPCIETNASIYFICIISSKVILWDNAPLSLSLLIKGSSE